MTRGAARGGKGDVPGSLMLPSLPCVGSPLREEWVAYAMSWGGAVFDLTILGWLLWRNSRPWAYGALEVRYSAAAHINKRRLMLPGASRQVQVRVDACVSYNGRAAAPLVDPTVELARTRPGIGPKSPILPEPRQRE